MCFVTHNRLILVITVLSIFIGILTFVSSVLIIHNSDQIGQVTVHIKFLIACTFCTVGAGLIQSVSSLLYLCRKLITRYWIGTNAIVFGIFLLGMCTAMVRFQSTLPEGFDAAVVNNRTHELLPTIPTSQPPIIKVVSNETIVDRSEENDVRDNSDEDKEDENETRDDIVEHRERINLQKNKDEDKFHDETVVLKARLLKFYFGSIMADFLALPIFLGLVSSKASKFELRGKSLIETCVVLFLVGLSALFLLLHNEFPLITYRGFVLIITIAGFTFYNLFEFDFATGHCHRDHESVFANFKSQHIL